MPHGIPNINNRPSLKEELASSPSLEVLGTVNPTITDPTPMQPTSYFTGPAGEQVTFTEPPPPWEMGDKRYAASDARQFVDVPENWELRWINPKTLDQFGWRHWQPVMASDPRVKVKVDSMVSVSNNIRRGGDTGDILAWMWKSWVESRRRELSAASAQLRQSSVDRTATLKEEFARGTYGPNVRVESARHPTHTIGEGRSMVDP